MGEADGEGRAPAVSVVVPTHDRCALLGEAVSSVRAQTFRDWELLVVDDGSTDGTRERMADLARRDGRVRLIPLDRCGNPARLRNVGIREARGAYVAFLDSDDLWEPEKLQVQVAALAADDRYRWSYTGFRLVDDRGGEIPLRAGRPWRPRSGDLLVELLRTEAAAPIQTLLVERALLLEVGLFDEGLPYKEDYDLVLRLASRSGARGVPSTLVSIRDHPGRSTRGREDVHEWSVRIYETFRDRTPLAEHRRLCDERCAYHLLSAARGRMAEGSHPSALGPLLRAFRYAPASPAWWRTAARWSFLLLPRILRVR